MAANEAKRMEEVYRTIVADRVQCKIWNLGSRCLYNKTLGDWSGDVQDNTEEGNR